MLLMPLNMMPWALSGMNRGVDARNTLQR
jgi:ABC-type siderophore export system fused ATPase/permease subunit